MQSNSVYTLQYVFNEVCIFQFENFFFKIVSQTFLVWINTILNSNFKVHNINFSLFFYFSLKCYFYFCINNALTSLVLKFNLFDLEYKPYKAINKKKVKIELIKSPPPPILLSRLLCYQDYFLLYFCMQD